jgi:succinate dehydrogenase / fumarate reductase cytochrome b subunit
MRFKEGLRYRGGSGMWAWIFHRVTGLGVLLFLSIHIIETFLLALGPEVYNRAIATYNTPFFRVAEMALVFAVLYHALNGIRVTIQDLWPELWRYERTFVWATAILTLAIFTPLAIWGLMPVFRGEL